MFEQGEVEIQRRPSSSGLLSPAAFINPAQYNNVLEGRFKQLQGRFHATLVGAFKVGGVIEPKVLTFLGSG